MTKKLSFNKFGKPLVILLVAAFALTTIVSISNYLIVKFYFPKTLPIPPAEVLSYQVENFQITIPKVDIYTSYNDKHSLNFYGKVLKTNMKADNVEVGSACTKVDNLYSLYLEKSFPVPDNINYYSRLMFSFKSWNNESLIFDSLESKNTAFKLVYALENLYNFEDPAKLKSSILDDNNHPTIDIWGALDSCGLIYSIPFKIKKLNLPDYDVAYYLEVSEGNGDTFSIPSNVLVLKKGQDWLIVKEQQPKPKSTVLQPWGGCPTGLDDDALGCVYDLWNNKYSSVEAGDIWINTMLNQIIYKPVIQKVSMDSPKEYIVQGVIKSEKIPKEFDIGDYWDILYFNKPFLLEDNSSGKPMYINRIEVGYLQKLDGYLNKQVEIVGILGWGYAESRTLSIKSIKVL